MPQTYDLTPTQRDVWCRRTSPLFLKEANCLKLARRVWSGEKEIKNNGGYIGEFRDGYRRALRYFLGDTVRLGLLANALGCETSQLESIWREVQGDHSAADDTLFLPGFEDWGPVSLDEGFVAPSARMQGTNAKDKPLREKFLAKLASHQLTVSGPRGSGVTTVLRRLATWAQDDGWHVAWGWDGETPEGRAVLLVLDTHDTPTDEALRSWSAIKGNSTLRGLTGRRPRYSGAGAFSGAFSASDGMGIEAVDEAWTSRLIATLRRVAPKADARRLAAIQPSTIRSMLATVPFPTPEMVGCLVRAHLDGLVGEIAVTGPRLVLESARRRLAGKGRRDDAQLLRGFEAWVITAYPNSVLNPSQSVGDVAEAAILTRAREVVDTLAGPDDREVLRAVLPLASGSAVVEALTAADVIREDPGGLGRFRYVPFLSAAVARAATLRPDLLRSAMIHGEHGFLLSVSGVQDGPRALARVLQGLSTPAFATAIRRIGADAEWLRNVAWDPSLVARALAVLLIKDVVGQKLHRTVDKAGGRAHGFWLTFDGAVELPNVEEVQTAVVHVAEELRVACPEYSEQWIAMVLAYLRPTAAYLLADTVWPTFPEGNALPAHWVDLLSQSREGLLHLTDATRSAVAAKLLVIEQDKLAIVRDGDTTHPRWLPLLERLVAMDAVAAAGVLCRMFDAVVAGTHALRGQVLDHRELQMSDTRPRHDANRAFGQYLSGIAVALQSPTMRRHRREIVGPLRHSLVALDEIACDPELPVEVWLESSFQHDELHCSSLAKLFGFCLTGAERVTALRAADGYLSPFWYALIESGVPIAESLRVLADVESGRLPYRTSRGAPSTLELENWARHNVAFPKPSVAANIRHCILDYAAPSEISQIPGFPDPSGTEFPSDAVIEQYQNADRSDRNIREYFWLFVRGIGEDSMLWRLLEGKDLYQSNVEVFDEIGGPSGLDGRNLVPESDLPGIKAAVALVPDAHLSVERWALLANAALLARIEGRSLAPLLASNAALQARPTLLVRLVLRVLADDPTTARDWLLQQLAIAPAVVDSQPFTEVWIASGIATDVWRASLAVRSAIGPCGDGLVLALVRSGEDQFEHWLAHDHLRDAALSALTTLPDWPERLTTALCNLASVPSAKVLAHIMRRKDRAWLRVLDESSLDWGVDLRMELWSRALGVATDGWQRGEIWQRMAVLNG